MFEHIIGNKKTLETLQYDVEHDRLAHAYLLEGSSYIGKFTILKEYAKVLQLQAGEDAQMEHLIDRNSHPDITIIDELPIEKEENITQRTNIRLEPRRSNMITVKDVQMIQEKISQTGMSPYSIAIITDIERMNNGAVNSLLKMIEEPPSPKTKFFFTTTNISRVPDTIVSRCKTLHLHTPSKESTFEFLQKQDFEITNIDELLKFIPPSPGYLYQLAKNPEKLEIVREKIEQLEDFLQNEDVYPLFHHVGEMKSRKEAFETVEYLEIYLQYMAEKTQKNPEKIDMIKQAFVALQRTKKYLRSNVTTKLAMEQGVLEYFEILKKL